MLITPALLSVTLASSLPSIFTGNLGLTFDVNAVTENSQYIPHKGTIFNGERDFSTCLHQERDPGTPNYKEYGGFPVTKYAKLLSLDAGFGKRIPAFSGHVKSSVDAGHTVSGDVFFYRRDYVVPVARYWLNLDCLPGKLNHNLLRQARSLPVFDDISEGYRLAQYNSFMDKWGTHLAVEQLGGGRISVQSVRETDDFTSRFTKTAQALFDQFNPRPERRKSAKEVFRESDVELSIEVKGGGKSRDLLLPSLNGLGMEPSAKLLEDWKAEVADGGQVIYHAKYATISSVLAKYIYPMWNDPRRELFVSYFDAAIVERGSRRWEVDFPQLSWGKDNAPGINGEYKYCRSNDLCLAYNPSQSHLELRKYGCSKFRLDGNGAMQIQAYESLGYLTFHGEGSSLVSYQKREELEAQFGLFKSTQSGYIRTQTQGPSKTLYLMFRGSVVVLSATETHERRLHQLKCSAGGLATVLA